MRLRLALAALAVAGSLTIGREAHACGWNIAAGADEFVEPAGARRARERRERSALLRTRTAAALAAFAEGYDTVGALAEILVPNIRPVPIQRDSCGTPNELDLADGQETLADLLAGTEYADWSDRYWDVAPPWDGETFGPACNAEFRARFAALLRSRMTQPQLRDAYLFLALRIPNWKGDPQPLRPVGHRSDGRTVISRLVAFEGRSRRLPVRWTARSYRDVREIRRWLSREPSGRALQGALDEFWRDNGPLLESSEPVCPEAVARWPSIQAQIVAPIEEAIGRGVNLSSPRR